MALICAALFAWGFLYRDGFPATGSTHLARAVGAFICLAGASVVATPTHALFVGLAVWASFYTDTKHGEGQKAQGLKDAFWLLVSGITSAIPLAIVNPWLAATALAKPPIWFVCWKLVPEKKYISPTRVAASLFGAVIGLALSLT